MAENNANQKNVQATQNVLPEEDLKILQDFENMRKTFEEKRNASSQTGGNEPTSTPSFDIAKEITNEEIEEQVKQLSGFSFEVIIPETKK